MCKAWARHAMCESALKRLLRLKPSFLKPCLCGRKLQIMTL